MQNLQTVYKKLVDAENAVSEAKSALRDLIGVQISTPRAEKTIITRDIKRDEPKRKIRRSFFKTGSHASPELRADAHQALSNLRTNLTIAKIARRTGLEYGSVFNLTKNPFAGMRANTADAIIKLYNAERSQMATATPVSH